ncbi:MAG: four helix bundle protein [Planctomycetes bacterium]|nr:four helix bundle protein [Planctomycetota bacterium]
MRRREPYEKLVVWQRAMDLVALVYRQVESFPDSEKSGLVAAMKKAVAVVPSKVADASHAGELEAYADAIKKLEAAQAALVELFNTALVARKVKAMGRGPLGKLRRACRRLDAQINKDIAKLEANLEALETARESAEAEAKAKRRERIHARVEARQAAAVLAVTRRRQRRESLVPRGGRAA